MANEPLYQSFYIWQGQTFNDTVTLQSTPGVAMDLTGYTAQMMVRYAMQDDPAILELSTANGGIVISAPTTGVLQFALSAAQTYALPANDLPQSWTYDLFITDSSGNAQNVMRGMLIVTPSATRPQQIPWWWWPMQDQAFPPLPGPPAPAPPWYTSSQAVGWQTASLIPPPGYPSTVTFPPPLDTAWPLPPGWPVGLSYPLPFGTPFPTLPVPSWWPVTIPYTPPTSPTNPLWYL